MTEQIIEHNGKRYRIIEELGPVRGPLGGEMVSLFDAPTGVPMYGRFIKHPYSNGHYKLEQPNGLCATFGKDEITKETKQIFEVNIPPRPTFTPMTAGEAAKLSDIVGRWVALPVRETDYSGGTLGLEEGYFMPEPLWVHADTPVILLPEGFGE